MSSPIRPNQEATVGVYLVIRKSLDKRHSGCPQTKKGVSTVFQKSLFYGVLKRSSVDAREKTTKKSQVLKGK